MRFSDNHDSPADRNDINEVLLVEYFSHISEGDNRKQDIDCIKRIHSVIVDFITQSVGGGYV